jgi:RNA polymerase sigma-70 factor (ECF subfamily)
VASPTVGFGFIFRERFSWPAALTLQTLVTRMALRHGSSLETRPSLLKRLQRGDDAPGWEEFYRLYGALIRHFASQAGLTPEEADDVLQETAIGVARRLPEFVYDPKVCRFKTWLLNQTRWQIRKQLGRRAKPGGGGGPSTAMPGRPSGNPADDTAGTDAMARIPDPGIPEFGAEWDTAWESNLIAKGLERVRQRIEERQFQIFDLYQRLAARSGGEDPRDFRGAGLSEQASRLRAAEAGSAAIGAGGRAGIAKSWLKGAHSVA